MFYVISALSNTYSTRLFSERKIFEYLDTISFSGVTVRLPIDFRHGGINFATLSKKRNIADVFPEMHVYHPKKRFKIRADVDKEITMHLLSDKDITEILVEEPQYITKKETSVMTSVLNTSINYNYRFSGNNEWDDMVHHALRLSMWYRNTKSPNMTEFELMEAGIISPLFSDKFNLETPQLDPLSKLGLSFMDHLSIYDILYLIPVSLGYDNLTWMVWENHMCDNKNNHMYKLVRNMSYIMRYLFNYLKEKGIISNKMPPRNSICENLHVIVEDSNKNGRQTVCTLSKLLHLNYNNKGTTPISYKTGILFDCRCQQSHDLHDFDICLKKKDS